MVMRGYTFFCFWLEHHVGVCGHLLQTRALAFLWYGMVWMDDTLLVVWLGWGVRGYQGGGACYLWSLAGVV
jgi:hypothetical protein